MMRAAAALNLVDWDAEDTEHSISISVGIIADGNASRRQLAAANLLALCAKIGEAAEFPSEAIEQIGDELSELVGFDDEAQRSRAKLPRQRRLWVRDAVREVVSSSPKIQWKELERRLEIGCILGSGELVKIQIVDPRIIATATSPSGAKLRGVALSHSTLRSYLTSAKKLAISKADMPF